MMQQYAPLIGKLLRFAVVGSVVTGGYAIVAYSGIHWAGLNPQLANLIGCLAAIAVSYIGQKYFTFRSQQGHQFELPRFLLVCTLAVVASSASVATAIAIGLDYRIGIVIAAVAIPLCNFVVLNLWVFANPDGK